MGSGTRSNPRRGHMSTTPDDASAQITFLRTGRHRVRVQTQGSGPPLLLLMGIGGKRRDVGTPAALPAEPASDRLRCSRHRRIQHAMDTHDDDRDRRHHPCGPAARRRRPHRHPRCLLGRRARTDLRDPSPPRSTASGAGVDLRRRRVRAREAVRVVDPRNATPILLATVLRQGRADALRRTHQQRTGRSTHSKPLRVLPGLRHCAATSARCSRSQQLRPCHARAASPVRHW